MQVDVENTFNNISRTIIFRELCDVGGHLANIVPFTRLFYGVHSFLYFQHGQHVEGVTNIESFSSIRQSDPLGDPLFASAHYRTFLETIVRALVVFFHS
jgi:tRNA U38,U39,U40 pseudouridine synthase TruA